MFNLEIILLFCFKLLLNMDSLSMQLIPEGGRLVDGAGCINIVDNVILLNICGFNVTNMPIPGSICLQGVVDVQMSVKPTPSVKLQPVRIEMSQPDKRTGYCNTCTACPGFCTQNPGAEFIPTTRENRKSTSIRITPGLLFSGRAKFCAALSQNLQCLEVIICNLKTSFLGIEIDQKELPTFCIEGNGPIRVFQNGDSSFSINLPEIFLTQLLTNEKLCTCSRCRQSCANNPLGCPIGGMSTTPAAPSDLTCLNEQSRTTKILSNSHHIVNYLH